MTARRCEQLRTQTALDTDQGRPSCRERTAAASREARAAAAVVTQAAVWAWPCQETLALPLPAVHLIPRLAVQLVVQTEATGESTAQPAVWQHSLWVLPTPTPDPLLCSSTAALVHHLEIGPLQQVVVGFPCGSQLLQAASWEY